MSKVKAIHLEDVKGIKREPPRTSWILISEKTVGSKNIAMGVNETYPGSMVPEHMHKTEKKVKCSKYYLEISSRVVIRC